MPGGVQLLSKRPEQMAPDQWPAYFREARGCETWDLDGRHYYDLSYNGIGACLLGFRDPDVTARRAAPHRPGQHVHAQCPRGGRAGRPVCATSIPGPSRCASPAAAARSAPWPCASPAPPPTARSIAICGYHGWQDWYLAANLGEDDALRGHLLPGLDPLGVPRELRGTALTFAYNDLAAFQAIVDRHGDRLAAVIMEPCRSTIRRRASSKACATPPTGAGALLIYRRDHHRLAPAPSAART